MTVTHHQASTDAPHDLPDPGTGVPWAAVRETHAGVVVLLGERAYKFKKPLDLGFLDYRTLEQRREACRREVELNSRMAPDVYLGVGELVGPDGVEDHVVMMRRMPDDRRLSTLVRSGAPVEDEVREVARRLAMLHGGAERSPEIAESGTVAALAGRWRQSFAQMAAYAGGVVPADVESDVERHVERYLAGRQDLFVRRVATGSVLDGHGDLMSDDIFCLPDGPRILDCLEFDDRLRHLDQVDDAAFLAMDLEAQGAEGLAGRFLEWYAEFSGDNAPTSLVHHYLAYRAFVRAKVACLRHDQGDPSAGSEARHLARVTLSHLQAASVKLVLVGGPPGSGKTTLAGGLADDLGMTLLSSDRVRKELANVSALESAAAPLGEGIYTAEWDHHVHEELMRRAAVLLRLGESVVVDATWSQAWQRDAACRAADASWSDLVALRCQVPAEVADARVLDRLQQAGRSDGSDADLEVARSLRASFEPWTAARLVDTSAYVDVSVGQAAALVRPADPRTLPRPRSCIEPD